MHRLFALSLGFVGLILATQSGWAQTARQCGDRARVLETLTGEYRETRRGMGLAGPSAVVELYASAETGSWTMTVTLPNGMTCLLASGQGWESLTEELPARGAPL